MSVSRMSLMVCLVLFVNLLVFSSAAASPNVAVRSACDPAVVGTWVGEIVSLNYLVIDLDAHLHGTLLGLKINGFVTTDITLNPLWIDLHLDIGIVVPCIYAVSIVNGVRTLTLGLEAQLLTILSGNCIRPLVFTAANKLLFKCHQCS